MCIRKHPYIKEPKTGWDTLLDSLGDDILAASDEEILERAKEDGRNPSETSRRVKGILRNAVESSMCDYGGKHLRKDCACDPYDTGKPEADA